MQRLGQHFLAQRSAAYKIVDALDPQRGELIIEIGAGHGELTVPLAERCARHGALLVAIERDGELVRNLHKMNSLHNVRVIYGDALHEIPLLLQDHVSAFHASRSTFHEYKLTGNIPYYLTGYLFRVLGSLSLRPLRTVLMIQKEVALRLTAHPPHMNRLAAATQFWAIPHILGFIPRTHFNPPPQVDSAIIELSRKMIPAELQALWENYQRALRIIFSQPRKTILNNFFSAEEFSSRSKQDAMRILHDTHIDSQKRPQDLDIDTIVHIAELLPQDTSRKTPPAKSFNE